MLSQLWAWCLLGWAEIVSRYQEEAEDLAQQQYKHLAESWRGLWIPFSFPYQIILGNITDWIMKTYIYDVGKIVGHGNRLKIWELAVCLIGVTIDDLGNNHVKINNVTGSVPTNTYKVAISYFAGVWAKLE